MSADVNVDTARICNLHFEKKYFGKRNLKSNAIPSLRLFEDDGIAIPSCSYEFQDEPENTPNKNLYFKTKVTSDDESVSELIQFSCEQQKELWKNLNTHSNNEVNSDTKMNSDLIENDSKNENENMEEFCDYCLKKEQNELFYRRKYTEALNLYKKEIIKSKKQAKEK